MTELDWSPKLGKPRSFHLPPHTAQDARLKLRLGQVSFEKTRWIILFDRYIDQRWKQKSYFDTLASYQSEDTRSREKITRKGGYTI